MRTLRRIFIALLLMGLSVAVMATEYYVDKGHPSASDSNSGTESSPFLTIQRGIDAAMPGDTVYIKAGNYNEQVNMRRGGSPGQRITITNFGTDRVVIDGTGFTSKGLVYWGEAGPDYITFDGIEITKAYEYAIWSAGSYTEIINCKIHNIGKTGIIHNQGDYNIINHNEVFNCGTRVLGNGIHLQNGHNNDISYNHVYDNSNHAGIQYFTWQTWEPWFGLMRNNRMSHNVIHGNETGIYIQYQVDLEISNNVVYENIDAGLKFQSAGQLGKVGPLTWDGPIYVVNNTFARNGDDAIWNEAANYLVIRNNIFYRNLQDWSSQREMRFFDNGIMEGHIIDNNLYDVGNPSGRLAYMAGSDRTFSQLQALGFESNGTMGFAEMSDPLTGDFRLTDGSDAIDVGADLSSLGITEDIDGTLRPQGNGYDVGAYEAQSDVTTPGPPSAPSGLRIGQ